MAKKIRNYTQLAKDILENVGGKENISNVTRCATRLRIVLKENRPDAKKKVSEMPGVISVVEKSGQFQVVIGQHVGEVYDEFIDLAEIKDDKIGEDDKPQGTILNRVIATMSAVFAPFIYILAAAGILQGSLIVINLFAPQFANTGTYEIFSLISWAPFTFLPIFIAITASKHFKTNTYISVAAVGALVSPDLTRLAEQVSEGGDVSFLGFMLSETTYTSTVLPALFLVWGLSYFERFLDKIFNETIRPLFTPFFSLIIVVPLTLLIIGPLTASGANWIAEGYNVLANNVPALAGALIGGFWQVFVIFGVHWGVTPMVLANFDLYGMDSFQAYQTIAVIAQVGAVIGVVIKTRKKDVRKVGISAGVTGIFGITEPSIYGITLRFKVPFIIGSISGAVGCIAASFFSPYYFAYAGLPGPLTIVNAISSDYPSSIWGMLIGVSIAVILPIVLIQFFGYGDDTAKQAGSELVDEQGTPADNRSNTQELNDEGISRPLDGKIIPLEEIPDPVFSSGAMGKGVGIIPSGNIITAPFDGEITLIAESKHAVGLRSKDGIEVLIHVGLNTVELKGTPFDVHVSDGDAVTSGTKLLTVDFEKIKEHELEIITPVIVTNTNEFEDIIVNDHSEDGPLLTVIK